MLSKGIFAGVPYALCNLEGAEFRRSISHVAAAEGSLGMYIIPVGHIEGSGDAHRS